MLQYILMYIHICNNAFAVTTKCMYVVYVNNFKLNGILWFYMLSRGVIDNNSTIGKKGYMHFEMCLCMYTAIT